MAYLPRDVWFTIVDHIDDIHTLHNLAMTAKSFCEIALPRMYHLRPMEVMETWPLGQAEDRSLRTSQFWRSIWCSTKPNRTMYQYASFLRAFDVSELESLLNNAITDESSSCTFFLDEDSEIDLGRRPERKDIPMLVSDIAPRLLSHCNNVLEIFMRPGNDKKLRDVRLAQFSNWLSYLPKLQVLHISHGLMLSSAVVRSALSKSCPDLVDLRINSFWGHTMTAADDALDEFLGEVTRSWRSIVLRSCVIGNKTLKRLNQRSDSLKHLELWNQDVQESLDWGTLAGFINLETIIMKYFERPKDKYDMWYPQFLAFFNGHYPRLRTLDLANVSCALQFAAIQLMANENFESLRIYDRKDERLVTSAESTELVKAMKVLCTGLAHQKNMTDLKLDIDFPEEYASEAVDQLTEAIIHMKALGSFDGSFGDFSDSHIRAMCQAGLRLRSLRLATFILTNDGLAVLGQMTSLTTFESLAPCHADGEAVLKLVETIQSLKNVYFKGYILVQHKQRIDEILNLRGGHFRNSEPYVPREDSEDESYSGDEPFPEYESTSEYETILDYESTSESEDDYYDPR